MPSETDTRPGINLDNNGMVLMPYGWRDEKAGLSSLPARGANQPSWSTITDGLQGWEFSATLLNELWVNFHIDHNYAPGSLVYPHVHIVPTDNTAGVVRVGFEYSVAKGHGQEAYPASTTIYLEQTVAVNTAKMHYIVEATEGQAFSDSLEPDTVVLTRVFRDAAHVNDTYAAGAHFTFADLHYQVDRFATLNKAPDFYD